MRSRTHSSIDIASTADLEPAQAGDGRNRCAVGTQWQFGQILVGDFRLDATGHGSSLRAPARYPQEHATNVVFICEGSVHITVDESTFVFVAGAGIVLPTSELPRFLCTESTRILIVSLKGPDADVLSELVPEHPTAIAAAVIETHPALAFLHALVATAQQHPIRTPPAGAIIAKLLASLLGADQEWHTRPNDPQVTEVLALIDRRHTDPGFDTKALARQLHLSTRDLDLLIGRHYGGRRLSDVLLERRLVTAMTLLHPGNAHSAEQIAFRSGFTSIAHLDDAIDTVYGLDTNTLLALQDPA